MTLLLPALFGCLREHYTEEDKVLSVGDITSVSIAAEELGEGNVYDTVVVAPFMVRANRSWSAVITYEGNESGWLRLSEEEVLNLHEYSVDEPISLIASRNKSTEARRATLTISMDADNKIVLPVEQAGQSRFIDGETDHPTAMSIIDTLTLSVSSNTSWTAAVAPESTADFTLSGNAGEDYGELKLCFAANDDGNAEKVAVVVLTAPGCAPDTVKVTQGKGSPYVGFRLKSHKIAPEVDTFRINFGANVNWTLSVKSVGAFKNCTLSQTRGGKTSTGDVIMHFDIGQDPGVTKTLVLELSGEGAETVRDTITQLGCLHLDFLDYDPNMSGFDGTSTCYQFKWPFESPTKAQMPNSAYIANLPTWIDTLVVFKLAEGYEFKGYGAKASATATDGGIWWHRTQGFRIGQARLSSYFEFPALEGLTLKTVIWEPSGRLGSTCQVNDAYGNNVKGGEFCKFIAVEKVTAEMMQNKRWDLQNTVPGEAYRLVTTYTGSVCIKDLILVYE
ncbi:MAG: hypothetical protein J5771_06860 [Bacteroidales bacterium]|nr:hypothetical protein [Bacteroidales bacterium]